jgi:hypothetical protein
MSDSDPREKPDDQPEVPATGQAGKPGGAIEIGGPKGPEPTRYGDWEKNGRCIDF